MPGSFNLYRRPPPGPQATPATAPAAYTGSWQGKSWVGPKPVAPPPDDQASPNPTSWVPGPLEKPGYGEDYYTSHKDQYDKPGAGSSYWQGQQGWFANPTQNEQGINRYGSTVGNTTSDTENFWRNNQGMTQNPGVGETTMGNMLSSGRWNAPTDSENYYGTVGTQLGNPGQFEQQAGGLAGQLAGPGYLEQHSGQIGNAIGGAQNMEKFFGGTQGQLNAPGYTEQLANGYKPEASYSENFLNGGGVDTGLDALYKRLGETQGRSLDERAAAGGGFNSGAALRNREELSKDLVAGQVKDELAARQQADAAKQARLGYGLNLMTGADTSMRGRIGLGYQGAQGADSGALARSNALESLYSGMGADKRANIAGQAGLLKDAQQSALDRIATGSRVADSSTAAGRNRTLDEENAAQGIQAQQGARFDRGLAGANASTGAFNNRYTTATNIAHTGFNDTLNRLSTGGAMAGAAGTEDYTRLVGGQNAATGAQNLMEGRLRGEFNDFMANANAQAQTYLKGMDPARQEQYQAGMEQINALLTGGKISQEAANAQLADLYQKVGLPLALLRAAPGAGGTPAAPRAALPPSGPGDDPLPLSGGGPPDEYPDNFV